MPDECEHAELTPVILAGTDETVAQLCVTCLASLPASYGCEECEWQELHVMARLTAVTKVCVYACAAHL